MKEDIDELKILLTMDFSLWDYFSNVQHLYDEKVLAYVYHKAKKFHCLECLSNIGAIEKYCIGVQTYTLNLMREADSLCSKLPFLTPIKGYIMNKYIYKDNEQRELSDIDFLCPKAEQQHMIDYMISAGYTITRLNNQKDLDIYPLEVEAILFEKYQSITIKIDVLFIENDSFEEKLIQKSRLENNPINAYTIGLYLLLIAKDLRKNHTQTPCLMKQLDLYFCFNIHSIRIEEVKRILHTHQDLAICNKVLKLIDKGDI